MKRIHILSFTLLIKLLFLSGLSAFGHSPCQPERDARDRAQREYDAAKSWYDFYWWESAFALWDTFWSDHDDPSGQLDRNEYTIDYLTAGQDIDQSSTELDAASDSLQSAENALSFCLAYAYRTCGCTVHHTESLTSCSCSYNTWNGCVTVQLVAASKSGNIVKGFFMKNPNFLYGLVIIAVIGTLSGFIGYTFPVPPPTQQAQAAENTAVEVTAPAKTTSTTIMISTPKTDGCSCCAGRRARLQRQRKHGRERKPEKQQTASVTSPASKN